MGLTNGIFALLLVRFTVVNDKPFNLLEVFPGFSSFSSFSVCRTLDVRVQAGGAQVFYKNLPASKMKKKEATSTWLE